jgi:hypothetical protein
MEKLQAEIQQRNISRYEKSALRDGLQAVRTFTGSERDVRSHFETQCMTYKRRNGYATEREIGSGPTPRDAGLGVESARRSLNQAEADARRAEMDARRADMAAQRAAADARRDELLRTRTLRLQQQP